MISLAQGSIRIFNNKLSIGLSLEDTKRLFSQWIKEISMFHSETNPGGACVTFIETELLDIPVNIDAFYADNKIYKIAIRINGNFLEGLSKLRGIHAYQENLRLAATQFNEKLAENMRVQNRGDGTHVSYRENTFDLFSSFDRDYLEYTIFLEKAKE